MARTGKIIELAAIEARRKALRLELAQLDEQAKAAEELVRDAGRRVLLAALERVKIASIDKRDAKSIAAAISRHGGEAVANALAQLA